jgi:hypothetical protein
MASISRRTWPLVLAAPAILAFGVSATLANQFWYTYEGNDYPEVEGPWARHTRAGGAQRSLVDGALVLDGMADWHIVDNYFVDAPFALAPGERALAEWRLLVGSVSGFADPAVGVCAGAAGEVLLRYREDAVYSSYEGVWISFTPGVFHQYVLDSPDLVTYELRIDGEVVYSGLFHGPSPQNGAAWGDATEGASSVSTWDYFRFGIVPEPSAGFVVGLAGLATITGTARSRRRTM